MSADFIPRAPLTVNWALSNRCNFSCSHCYSRVERQGDLDLPALMGLLDKLVAARVLAVNFGGGEPLLHAGVVELATRATARGVAVSMNSNGFLLDAARAEALARAGFRKIGISVDSHDAAVHDRFRGIPGSHARALAALDHLRDAGIETSLSAVICRINAQEFRPLVDLAAAHGCKSVNFHNFKCSGNGMVNKDELDLSPGEWRAFYVEALAVRGERKDLHISLEDPVIALLGETGEASLVHGSVCGKLSLSLKPNGDLTPCGFMPVVVGNLLRDDLLEIWRTSPVLLGLRRKEARGKCSGCEAWNDCLGGCSARALALTGDFHNPDPHCWRA